MRTSIILPLVFMALCFACSDDDDWDGDSGSLSANAEEGLVLNVDIEGMDVTTYTRATQEAWTTDNWNESTLKRLDVFIYEQGSMTSKVTVEEVCSLYVEVDKSYAKKRTRYTTYTTTTTVTYSDGDSTTTSSSTTTVTSQTAEDWDKTSFTVTDGNGTTTTLSTSNTSATIWLSTTTTTTCYYNYTCKLHDYTTTDTELSASDGWQLTYSDGSRIPATWLKETDSIFVVANYEWTTEPDSTTYATPAALEALTATYYNSGNAYSKQDAFVMAGRALAAGNYTDSNEDNYGIPQLRTVTVSMTRACAKLCLHVWYKAEDADYYVTQQSFSSNNASCRLVHYVTKGALFDNTDYTISTTSDSTSTTYDNTPQMYAGTKTITSSNQSVYGGTVGGTVDDYCAVYYVFPTSWYDSSVNMWVAAPILYDYWTHFLIKVVDTKAAMNYTWEYSVPINYTLPTDNDAAYPDPSYIDLYHIYRNHVYDVNVYVQENSEGYIVTLSIDDLTEGTSITITADAITADDGTNDSLIEDLESTTIDYFPDE